MQSRNWNQSKEIGRELADQTKKAPQVTSGRMARVRFCAGYRGGGARSSA